MKGKGLPCHYIHLFCFLSTGVVSESFDLKHDNKYFYVYNQIITPGTSLSNHFKLIRNLPLIFCLSIIKFRKNTIGFLAHFLYALSEYVQGKFDNNLTVTAAAASKSEETPLVIFLCASTVLFLEEKRISVNWKLLFSIEE